MVISTLSVIVPELIFRKGERAARYRRWLNMQAHCCVQQCSVLCAVTSIYPHDKQKRLLSFLLLTTAPPPGKTRLSLFRAVVFVVLPPNCFVHVACTQRTLALQLLLLWYCDLFLFGVAPFVDVRGDLWRSWGYRDCLRRSRVCPTRYTSGNTKV